MARILIAYKQFPARSVGHAGGESIYWLLEALHRRGHQLTLVARMREEERPLLDQIRPLCARIETVPHHRSLSGPRPWAILRSYWALRQATLRTLRETRPDLFHIEFAQTAVALLGISYPRTSFRAHDVNWFMLEQQAAAGRGWRADLLRILAGLLRQGEPWLYRRFNWIAAISEGDRRLLAPACAPQPVYPLPLASLTARSAAAEPAVPPGPNVVFVGALSRAFNIAGAAWFLDTIWPRITAAVPDARFYIVGGGPPAELLARHDGRHCFVTGFVPDLAPWYRAAAVFVSPLQVAGGLLQKVVDAMTFGVPVVATSGSNHGLGAVPGEHLQVADTPEDFAAAVIRLLQDPEAGRQLGEQGRQFIQEHYDAEAALDRWLDSMELPPSV